MRTLILFIISVLVGLNVSSSINSEEINNYLIKNEGQVIFPDGRKNTNVKYFLNSNNNNVSITKKGWSYDTYKLERTLVENNEKPMFVFHRIDFELIGINSSFKILENNSIYMKENSHGKKNMIEKVIYKDIYDNIDIEFINDNGQFEYNFILHPGAKIQDIRINVKGSKSVKKNDGKNISILTTNGQINENIPLSYILETKKKVEINFDDVKTNDEGYLITFQGETDPNKSLVIDPVPLLSWSTYFGGGDMDFISGVDEDNSENIIIGGSSFSVDNISTVGSHLETHPVPASSAGVLSKFDSNGNQLWGTYVGGDNSTLILDVKADNNNNIIIVGFTNSSSGISSVGSHQETIDGGEDGFIMKFDPNGQLLWGTYFGGQFDDLISNIVIDGANDIYITGHSESTTNISTAGAFQEANAGGTDIFLAKFSANGNQIWGSYYGGMNEDFSSNIELTSAGRIVFYGRTSSTDLATTGAYQETLSGGNDAVLGVFTETFELDWATYFGGTGSESPSGLAVDLSDSIIIYGRTSSSDNIASLGAHQEVKRGFMDTYLAKFDNSGIFDWGTYFGGSDDEFYTGGLSCDGDNNIFLTGATYSTDYISTAGAIMPENTNSAMTIFLGQFDPNGVQLAGTYYGENDNSSWGDDMVYSNSTTKLILTGRTSSLVGFTAAGAHQESFGGGSSDGYITVFEFCDIDPTITKNEITLTSNELGASYQWYDCVTNTPITGETNDSYIAEYNSSFACAVTNVNCTIMSECVEVTTVGLLEENFEKFKVFPNPAKSEIHVVIPNDLDHISKVFISDITGRIVLNTDFGNEGKIDVSSLNSGTYYLKFIDEKNANFVSKFIIAR